MAAPQDSFPHLDLFLNAYMHQDWRIFGETLEAVIAAYAEDTSPEEVAALRGEIARLIETEGDQLEVDWLRRYPNSVLPSGWDMTAQQWLRRISELATAHTPEAVPGTRR